MAAGHDDDGTACARSLSESLETQGGKQDGGRHHERTRTNSSPCPQWGVATRKYAVEAIGAFFLTFAIGAAALSGSVFVPLAAGAMLMVMNYAGGHISGGHYNRR
jgi:aquaporin Z